jgi:hypothetical protein
MADEVIEGVIELEVSNKSREYGITREVILGDSMIKAVYKDKPITATLDKKDVSGTMRRFEKDAADVIRDDEIVQHLKREMTSHISNHVEQITKKNGNTITKNNKQQVTVCKYTDIISGKLYETVKFSDDGKFYLVSYDSTTHKLVIGSELEEDKTRTLKPYTEIGTEAYTFEDSQELEQYIELAKKETLGSLFKKVKHYAKLFYDTDTEEYTNLIAADIVFSYFQDRIGKTHYIFVYGEPGTGKGAILETFNQLAYRGVQVTDASAASVYRLLGAVEKGQVILIVDEANRLEDDSFLLDVLKVGYKGSTKVPRVMDAQSSESKVEYFYAFCFKIIAAEHLPAHWKTGGFLSRCLLIHTSPGNPPLDISDIVDNAGDQKNVKVMLELSKLRKLLFAYRLLHYHEPIPDIGGIKGIFGRDRELIKPLIRLFKAHGDTESLDIVKETLHYFVKERNQETTDSFVATVYHLIRKLIDNSSNGYEFRFSDIRDYVREQLDGENLETATDEDGKTVTGSFRTDLFGEISTKRLAWTLRKLGGVSARDKSGSTRVWKFDSKTLDRFSTVYRQVPDTLELEGEGQQTLDENDDIEQGSDGSDTSDT